MVYSKLQTIGDVTESHLIRDTKHLTPDFIVTLPNGDKMAVEVGYLKTKRKSRLYRKAFQIIMYLKRFDCVFYIAPYHNLKAVCDLLETVGITHDSRFKTADIHIYCMMGLTKQINDFAKILNQIN